MKKRQNPTAPAAEEDAASGDSNDLSENLYGDGSSLERQLDERRGRGDTVVALLEAIVAELRALREETHQTRLAMERLGARIDRVSSAAKPGKRQV